MSYENSSFSITDFLKSIGNLPPEEQRRLVREKMIGLQKDIDEIQAQLDDARQKVATQGVFSDPTWYTRANYNRRLRGRQVQQLQHYLGDVLKSPHKLNTALSIDFGRCFMKVAKETLTGAVYEDLLNKARKIQEERILENKGDTK